MKLSIPRAFIDPSHELHAIKPPVPRRSIRDSPERINKILAIEIAGLGDLVHSLPALWAIRQHYPTAQLHCLVQSGNASLLSLLPWIDRVIVYRRRAGPHYYLGVARNLRAESYDLAIDLIGADHSGLIAGISAARHRLIRRPGRIRLRWAWRCFATDLMCVEFGGEAMYLQRLHCVQQFGVTVSEAVFRVEDGPAVPGIGGPSHQPYIHVSPFTKLHNKELPLAQMAALIVGLMAECPRYRLMLSCSAKPRELLGMQALIALLPLDSATVYAGTLNIPQLYSLIGHAALHVGGDTGTLHLAWLAGTPSVSWFRARAGLNPWVPRGRQHRVYAAAEQHDGPLLGIDNQQVIGGALRSLSAGQ